MARSLRALASHIPVLVVAPWLSARTRELLAAENINYLDLAGNARLQLDNPALYLKSVGAQRNPAPPARGQARLRGPKAGRLVRLLADVRPPYGVRQIAAAANLSPGYVSRLLDALDREALIDRGARGPVQSVDVAALLRRWAESYDVFKANNATAFLAPAGPAAALERLANAEPAARVAVTGSFAAVRRALVAAPAFLTLYCDDAAALADGCPKTRCAGAPPHWMSSRRSLRQREQSAAPSQSPRTRPMQTWRATPRASTTIPSWRLPCARPGSSSP